MNEKSNIIIIDVKTVYGKPVIYPFNDQAKLLAQIAGTETLSLSDLALAERMGFYIRQEVAVPKTPAGRPIMTLVRTKGEEG